MSPKFFIDRPIFATVISILMVLGGLIAIFNLPISQYPDITPPTVTVSALYPGASAEIVAQNVGNPIETQVNGIEGMLYMNSSSSSNGQYKLTVTFELGTDLDIATVMVQNRVAIAEKSLPQSVLQQGIITKKQSTNIVLFISLLSDNPVYDGLYLANYASLNITSELGRLPGVGSVTVFGSGDYSMRIWFDPEVLRIRGLTPMDVITAIQAQNIQVSAGNVGQPPTDIKEAYQYTLTTKGRLMTAEEFGDIIIRSTGSGQFLRLKDIAKIDLGSVDYSVVTQQRGKQSAAVAIYQLPGSNSLQVAKAVKAKMAELSKAMPADVRSEVTLDTTDFITASVEEVLITFLETTLLVVLVILIFLQNFRAVIIPFITIPVSLITTFAVMKLLGFSINTLTLFGLILAIAIVVDDAIVVVENSSRLLQTGKYTPKEAVTEAMDEIVGPVIGTVLVLLAVFIPTAFIGGITGQMYKQFALTIAASTLLSGINSLTLTPALATLLLRKENPPTFFVYKAFNKGYDKLLNKYTQAITHFLKHPRIVMMVYLLIALIAFWGFIKWPTSFIPEEDQGYFIISAQLPPAANLQRTEQVSVKINAILDQFDEIKTYIGINGYSVIQNSMSTNSATFFVVLKNWKDRKEKQQSAWSVIQRINEMAYSIQEAQIFAMNPPAIPGLGANSGLEFELQDRNSLGIVAMQNAIQALISNIKEAPAIQSISTMYQANVPQYYLRIDRDKAQSLNLSVNDIFQVLSYSMGSTYVNDYTDLGNTFQVKLGTLPESRASVQNVLKLSVRNSLGQMVPFSSFTNIEEVLGIDQITRYNTYQAASLTVMPKKGSSSSAAIKEMEQLANKVLGSNYAYSWTSQAFQEQQSGSSVMLVFGLAIVVVILVLAAQYESFTSPFAVIMGVPIALIGTLLGCSLLNLPISLYSQIGIILLIGLSAKNGILIVEFARDFRKSGKSITDAAIQAGNVRLRPILMTSFAFVFGVTPLIFASGAGAESRISLGVAVVFGMAINAIFATIFIPSFYQFTETIQEKLVSKQKTETNKKDSTADTDKNNHI